MTTKATMFGESIETDSLGQSLVSLKEIEKGNIELFLKGQYSQTCADRIVGDWIAEVEGKAVMYLVKANQNVVDFEAKLHTVVECIDLLNTHKR